MSAFGGKADIDQPLLNAAWRRFVACVEALPPNQAAPGEKHKRKRMRL
jgi:hypothetical protein